jgi:hypothetical protein
MSRITDEAVPEKSKQTVERAKFLTKLRKFEEQWRAFECGLREEEAEIWQPHWK